MPQIKTKLSFTPRFHETDMMGVVHNAEYFRWFEEGRMQILLAVLPLDEALELGVAMPVVKNACTYKKPVRFGDPLLLYTHHEILTAYEGRRPVFTTLVSTGRRGAATPGGNFRIWAKLATGEMSGEAETIDDSSYLMQGVPWVMYFNEGVAIHGAYWHDQFGRRRSHGCVNVAPRDAAFLFGCGAFFLRP